MHIRKPNEDNCLYYPSNIFGNKRGFENWSIFSDIPMVADDCHSIFSIFFEQKEREKKNDKTKHKH